MINRKYNKKISNNVKKRVNILLRIIVGLVVLFFVFMLLLQSSIKEAVAYQCKAISTKTIAEEAEKTLEQLNVKYEDIIVTKTDDSGKISSVSINTIEANKIKNEIETKISNQLIDFKRHTYKIPLGTVIGSNIFAGRGPTVPLKLSPTGYVKTELVSDFKTAGINQTTHNINLIITVNMSAVVPMCKTDTETNTNLLIAQTIIVGDVPNYYSNIRTNDENLKNDIKQEDITKQNLD